MNTQLSAIEARIIGCLIEKEVTTPDHYPLTLNSLTTACNQKSNREPVLSLSESDVLDAVDGLISRRLVSDESGFNSRVSKYQHRFCNTEFGDLQFTEQERAIICCMLLRGAQTPGELRTRTGRLANFADVKELEAVLDKLAAREEGALVVKLPREAGKRESRYQHLLSGEVDLEALATSAPVSVSSAGNERIESLEAEVEGLKQELAELKVLVESLI
ncbi:YceH family protein [Vibrio sp. D404a]|uniref:YceH family protein n=1 Tax=unclassified Vibrio TaxID=2614977 RepID=UPI00255581C5|nr:MULTISPECIES: YceH family protein [unclassified Vibrio]MDK9737272.1 YceH family protein [Vibrio sp. D404a]MDK9798052.1 YceH family protein [Vibrio sp. D449a]